jgi:integrase
MTKPSREYSDREPLSNEEIDAMLLEADKIPEDYFQLRVKALNCIAKKFGKRRSEVAALEREDLKAENGQLYVTFTLRKKHKKGLFQYLKFLKKHNPAALNKPHSELDWKLWTQTKEGYRVKEKKRTIMFYVLIYHIGKSNISVRKNSPF